MERDGRVGNGDAGGYGSGLEENEGPKAVNFVTASLVSVKGLLGSHPDVYILDQGVVAVSGCAEFGEHRVVL